VLKNVTITLPEEVAQWARIEAAKKSLSVSKYVARLLEEKMGRRSAEYWAAFEEWKKIKAFDIDAEHRMTREEAHERRR
jgi:hypothetical protein